MSLKYEPASELLHICVKWLRFTVQHTGVVTAPAAPSSPRHDPTTPATLKDLSS